MRAVVQRVSEAGVTVDGRLVGEIGNGLLALVGIALGDEERQSQWMAERLAHLRIFPKGDADMEASLLEVGGAALLVSQFTLYGDARRGRRPSYLRAARGPEAQPVFEAVAAAMRALDIQVATGEFGSMMKVALINDGPCTILIDSEKGF